jgi:hypothetical protein
MAMLTKQRVEALAILANGIIPADERDAGAQSANAAEKIALKIEQGSNAQLYIAGLELAGKLAQDQYGQSVEELTPPQVHQLIAVLREKSPVFYKQLRMDVSAAYLADPGVWARIGFPGPSIDTGGYADFDQPQSRQ